MRTCLQILGLGVVLLALTGCSGPQIAPVKGRVTCNGKPVHQASVIFAPEPSSDKDREPGKGGTGITDKDGNYVISTYRAYDGAQVGKHKVTIALDDANPARCSRLKHLQLEVTARDNVLDIELADK
jgi:hypothetical protein